MRLVPIGLALTTVALGLLSRRPAAPALVRDEAGDVLYALLVVWLLRGLRPQTAPARVATAAFVLCGLLELSQALHPPWLDALRAHPGVALVLGRGFVWADLGRYALGAALGGGLCVGLDRARPPPVSGARAAAGGRP